MLRKYLNGIDNKDTLPIHAVQGSGEYDRVKTQEKPVAGNEGEPEFTQLGCPNHSN